MLMCQHYLLVPLSRYDCIRKIAFFKGARLAEPFLLLLFFLCFAHFFASLWFPFYGGRGEGRWCCFFSSFVSNEFTIKSTRASTFLQITQRTNQSDLWRTFSEWGLKLHSKRGSALGALSTWNAMLIVLAQRVFWGIFSVSSYAGGPPSIASTYSAKLDYLHCFSNIRKVMNPRYTSRIIS